MRLEAERTAAAVLLMTYLETKRRQELLANELGDIISICTVWLVIREMPMLTFVPIALQRRANNKLAQRIMSHEYSVFV